jgi:hypothetical protein
LLWFSVILRFWAAKHYLFFSDQTESCTSGIPSGHPLRSFYVGDLTSWTLTHLCIRCLFDGTASLGEGWKFR